MTERWGYTWGRLTKPHVQAWAELMNTLAHSDGTEEFVQAEDLAEERSSPTFDDEQDTWAIWSGEDLVGHGYVIVPTTLSYEGVARMLLWGGIHPDHRGRGLGTALLERQEERSLALAAQRHPGHPTVWLAEGGIEGADALRFLLTRGYDVARYFVRMRRPLPGAPLRPQAPPGYELLTPTEEVYEALRGVHNDAFRDHWGSGEKSAQAWQLERTARWARPAFGSMAVDRDGRPVSYALCAEWEPRKLYVDVVGTARQARGRGLAAACLARTILAAAASGSYDSVELGVDSASPTGANRLYESVGFEVDQTFTSLHRPGPLTAPPPTGDVPHAD